MNWNGHFHALYFVLRLLYMNISIKPKLFENAMDAKHHKKLEL